MVFWGSSLSRLLDRLRAARPKGVALDLLFPVDPDATLDGIGAPETFRPGLELENAVAAYEGSIVLGRSENLLPAEGLRIAAQDHLGLIEVLAEPDGVTRRVVARSASGASGLAAQSARIFGGAAPPTARSMFANFTGVPLPSYSATAILDGSVDMTAFRGAIVVVGTSFNASGDFHVTPFGEGPGVQVQAQALSGLLDGATLTPWETSAEWLAILLSGLIAGEIARRVRPGLAVGLLALGALAWLFLAKLGFASGSVWPVFRVIAEWVGAGVAVMIGQAIFQSLRLSRMRAQFGAFLSEGVTGYLEANPLVYGAPRPKTPCVCLFLDIRGFTRLSEQLGAEELTACLNHFFARILPIVEAHGGHVMQFTGDGFLATFGVPRPLEAMGDHALACAREIVLAAAEFRDPSAPEGLRIGIGLHAGEVAHDLIGSKDRHAYTVLGATVNLASRLESLTKELDAQIVFSEAVVTAGGRVAGAKGPIEREIRGLEAHILVYHE